MASSRVQLLSLEHLLPIGIALLFLIFILKLAKTKSAIFQQKLIHYIAVGISLTLIVFHLHKILFLHYNYKEDLPLFLCSFMGLIIPIFTYYRKSWMFEILVFWVIAGTLQGIITPDIAVGFPSFDFFRYWIVHLGLLIVIIYAIKIFKMRPKLRSVIFSYSVFQLYILVMLFLNYLLGSNYGYLNRKPKSASLIDVLGDWPYYIIKADVLLLFAFIITWLCFKSFKAFQINEEISK